MKSIEGFSLYDAWKDYVSETALVFFKAIIEKMLAGCFVYILRKYIFLNMLCVYTLSKYFLIYFVYIFCFVYIFSLSHTRTHTRTHTRKNTHTRLPTHTHTHIHTLTYTDTNTQPHTRIHTHIHTCKRTYRSKFRTQNYRHISGTCTHAHAYAHTHTNEYARTYMHIHTHTHKHTHARTYTHSHTHVNSASILYSPIPLHVSLNRYAITFTHIHTQTIYINMCTHYQSETDRHTQRQTDRLMRATPAHTCTHTHPHPPHTHTHTHTHARTHTHTNTHTYSSTGMHKGTHTHTHTHTRKPLTFHSRAQTGGGETLTSSWSSRWRLPLARSSAGSTSDQCACGHGRHKLTQSVSFRSHCEMTKKISSWCLALKWCRQTQSETDTHGNCKR